MSSDRLKTGSRLVLVAAAATCAWGAVVAPQGLEQAFVPWDKAAHFIAFLAGGVLMAMALRYSTAWSWKRIALLSAVTISLFGATDEYHQTFTPNRSGADVSDWIADALGACTGAALMTFPYARSTRPHQPAPTRD